MVLDDLLKFSDAQAITSTVESTNVVDFSIARDMGTGTNLYIAMVIDTSFTATSSLMTLTVTLETSGTASFASATTAQTLFTTGVIPAAGTGPGATTGFFQARVDPNALNQRYGRLKYTANVENATAGAVSSYMTYNTDKPNYFASGFSVLK